MSYGMGGHAAKFYGFGDESNMDSWKLPAEFNDIKHTKGILSMARSNDKNSAGVSFLFVMVIHLIWMLSILFLEELLKD